MQQMLGKLAWEEEGREKRESNVTLPQQKIEGNDSEMFQQVLDRQFGVAKDGPKKTGPIVSPECTGTVVTLPSACLRKT
jgi:hypothetical protein